MPEPPVSQVPGVLSSRFTLSELLVGILMLAIALSGLRGLIVDTMALGWLYRLAIAMGLGGLYGVIFRRNAWVMCLVWGAAFGLMLLLLSQH